MKKHLDYITVGSILRDLEESGLKIPRATFYNLEECKAFPNFNRRTTGNWRVFTDDEAKIVKGAIWKNYKGTPYPGR
jgi:hypothetical protein